MNALHYCVKSRKNSKLKLNLDLCLLSATVSSQKQGDPFFITFFMNLAALFISTPDPEHISKSHSTDHDRHLFWTSPSQSDDLNLHRMNAFKGVHHSE